MMNNWTMLRIYAVLILMGIISILQMAINQMSHSLTVLADCYHNFYVLISFVLLLFNQKAIRSVSLRATFGWARIEVLGTLVNIIFTLALCLSIFVEGLQSLAHSAHHDIQPTYPYFMLGSGVASLAINWIKYALIGNFARTKGCYLSIHGQEVQVNCVVPSSSDLEKTVGVRDRRYTTKDRQKEMASGNTDCLINSPTETPPPPPASDDGEPQPKPCPSSWLPQIIKESGTSVLLIITSSMILLDFSQWIHVMDSILGIVAVFFIFSAIYPTLKESGLILLQTVPNNIDLKSLRKSLKESLPSILSIHDLHIWCLTGDRIIATCHLSLPLLSTAEYREFSLQVKNFFAKNGILFVTIQPEFRPDLQINNGIDSCIYLCKSSEDDCLKKVCCHPEGYHAKGMTEA